MAHQLKRSRVWVVDGYTGRWKLAFRRACEPEPGDLIQVYSGCDGRELDGLRRHLGGRRLRLKYIGSEYLRSVYEVERVLL